MSRQSNILHLFGTGGQQPYRGASRDRRLPGKARRRQRKAQNAAQRANVARAEAAILAAPQVAVFGLRDLEEKTVPALQALAKNLGLKGYSKLKKDELVEFIYRSEENTR